jgi:hypothetical protein
MNAHQNSVAQYGTPDFGQRQRCGVGRQSRSMMSRFMEYRPLM